jgi:hypothetical protein
MGVAENRRIRKKTAKELSELQAMSKRQYEILLRAPKSRALISPVRKISSRVCDYS